MEHAIGKELPSSIFATDTNFDPPPSNNKSPTGATRRRWAIIILASSLTVLVLGAIIGITWLTLKPHELSIAVSLLSLSNFNPSDTQLKSNSDALLIGIANPSKVSNLVIDPFNVSVYYHGTQLSVASVPAPIHLQRLSQARLKVELGVQDQFGHSKVAASPEPWEQFPGLPDPTKLFGAGNGDFYVKTSIRTKFKALHMLTWRMHFDVSCRISDLRIFNPDNTWDVFGAGGCTHV